MLTANRAIQLVFLMTLATILSAWIFQYAGYAPCELCLKQRLAYYIAVPLSAAFALVASNDAKFLRLGLIGLGLLMLVSMGFGIYHSGVEWKLWAGPATCTGDGGLTGGLPDLSKPAVMCDQPAIRILGLSLAGWNAVVSAATSFIAFKGAKAF